MIDLTGTASLMVGRRSFTLGRVLRAKISTRIGACSIGLAVGMLLTAPPAVAQSRPTNLRVSNFEFDGTVQRFTIEWDAATNALGQPYPSYQVSRRRRCEYQTLNPGDKVVATNPAFWVLSPAGPRLGLTVLCRCPRRREPEFAIGVVAVGSGFRPLPAKIAPQNVPARYRDASNPSAVFLDCSD